MWNSFWRPDSKECGELIPGNYDFRSRRRGCGLLFATVLSLLFLSASALASPVIRFLNTAGLAHAAKPCGRSLAECKGSIPLPDTGNLPLASGIVADGAASVLVVVQTDTAPSSATMSVTNAASLVVYQENCASSPPQAGSDTLTVSGSQIVEYEPGVYILALLQAPDILAEGPEGTYPDYTQPITLNVAIQNGPEEGENLQLYPPPVLFLHGIWGDSSSLQNVAAYLANTAPWSGLALDFLRRFSYPNSIAFDSTQISDQVTVQLNQIAKAFYDAKIALSRVDIVAHSMGGLVARHFSTLSNYKSPYNRTLGVFHQIITLNTPELCSQGATFLYNNEAATFSSNATPIAQEVVSKCTNAGITTVAPCMSKLLVLLAPPGLPLDQGAVYSLQPSSHNIAMLPSPNIPNATWNAISSTVSQGNNLVFGTNLLVFELDKIISATCPGASYCQTASSTIPTITSILGTTSNDGVVTLASQTSQCSGSCTVKTFQKLAHTKGVVEYHIDLVLNNNNVENSSAVDSAVACELANCTNTGQGINLVRLAAAEEEQPSQATRQGPTRSFVPHEVKAVWSNPTQGAAFGVPFAIHLAIPYERVGSVHVNQWDSKNEHNEDYDAAVEKAADGNTLVNVTPLSLKKTEFTLEADLGFLTYSKDRFTLNVAPPPVRPLTFWPDQGSNEMGFSGPRLLHVGQTAPMDPIITVAALPHKVLYIKRYATFRAIQDVTNPVVDLHPDGSFTALREGKAAIEVNFAGYTTSLTVEVNQKIPLLMP